MTPEINPKLFIIILSLLSLGTVAFLGLNNRQDVRISPLYSGVSDNSLSDYFNFTNNQAENQEQSTEVTFNAVGDIMLSREVARQIYKNQKDSYWPFRNMEKELTMDADFNFGNLESPFNGTDDISESDFLKFNAPTWAFNGLVQYNFKVLNLANNHAFDQNLDGLLYTKNLLEKNSLTGVGTGLTKDEAWQGKVFSIKGIRIGFMGASYASENDGGYARNDYVARIEALERLSQSISDLKTRSDYIVVTMHAGTEYQREPAQNQINFARAVINNGADMVIGAHPHWIQKIENYKGKQIFYSLGNFVFDQMWSQETREGLMLKITLTKPGLCHPGLDPFSTTPLSRSEQINVVCTSELQGSPKPATLKQVELLPIVIEHYGQPRLATPQEKQSILNKIGATTNVITPE